MRRIIILFLIALFLFLPSASMAKGARTVTFDDPVLEAALREAVGIPQGDVTADDLAKLTRLSIARDYEQNPNPDTQVHSIAALAYCTALDTLELKFQNITDITPLAKLKKLKTLELGGNPIADIKPLANKTALVTLSLYNCQAKDYTPLKKLKALQTLFLDYSTIDDLTPLKKLTSLTTLGLKSTRVTDVTPLARLTALQSLYLSGCPVRDFSPIKDIYNNLAEKDFEYREGVALAQDEVVVFDDPVLETAIRDALYKPEGDVYASELATLGYLGTGKPYEQNPPEGSRVRSIAVLKYCTNLTGLELLFNQITDASVLAGLTGLTEIWIGGNPIAVITPFAGLTNLKTLALFNCQAKDYTPLANLTNLNDLALDFSTITDLTPLAGLTQLESLSLNGTSVTDVTPIAGLTALRTLRLKDCPITDFTPISALIPNLTEMDFDPEHPATEIVFKDPAMETLIRGAINMPEGKVFDTMLRQITELKFMRMDDQPQNGDITDLSVLRYCTGLRQLTLNGISAVDLSPLKELKALEGLTLLYSKATDYSALASLTNLNWLDLTGSTIDDLTPLAELTNLNALTLCFTDVTDLTPLQNLNKLFGLKLEGTHITDYSPLAALYPNLGKRDFILPEQGAVRFYDPLLEERVRKAMNKPEGDITPEEAAAVTSLDLSQVENSETSISILQGLEAFTGLTELNLSYNQQVADLWPISGLTKLEKLNCWKCNIQGLKPVANLTALKELSLGFAGYIGNLNALANLVNLVSLDAKGMGIWDISGLTGLPKLEYVGLSENKISDFAPIATLPSLNSLDITGNLSDDYSVLASIYPKLVYKDFTLDGAEQPKDTTAPQSADGKAGSENMADAGDGWRYDEATGMLWIDSDAAMVAYRPDQEKAEQATKTDAPWAPVLPQIQQIIVGDEVTLISDYAFAYALSLQKITIGSNVASLGERCLYRCGDWNASKDIEIDVNCAAMPVLGNDVMGYTWDNKHAFLTVPAAQADQWMKVVGGTSIRVGVK